MFLTPRPSPLLPICFPALVTDTRLFFFSLPFTLPSTFPSFPQPYLSVSSLLSHPLLNTVFSPFLPFTHHCFVHFPSPYSSFSSPFLYLTHHFSLFSLHFIHPFYFRMLLIPSLSFSSPSLSLRLPSPYPFLLTASYLTPPV